MKLRLLFSGSTPPSAFGVKADSGIRTVKDLKGKKVMLTRPTNWTFTRCGEIILKSAGMTKEDIIDVTFSGMKAGQQALSEGRVSAVIFLFPSIGLVSWAQELNIKSPLRFISGEEKAIEAVLPEVPYARKATLYAKYYGAMVGNKDLVSVGTPHQFLTNPDLPPDLVYEVMRSIFEHLKELYPFHPDTEPYTEDPLALAVVPYHSGAIKYFKEKGLWTPKLDEIQQRLLKQMGVAQ